MIRQYESLLELISDQVAIYLDVFRALMKHRVGSNVHGCLAVTVQWDGQLNGNLQVLQSIANSKDSVGHCTIFSLG